jgi:hypothetical protein
MGISREGKGLIGVLLGKVCPFMSIKKGADINLGERLC